LAQRRMPRLIDAVLLGRVSTFCKSCEHLDRRMAGCGAQRNKGILTVPFEQDGARVGAGSILTSVAKLQDVTELEPVIGDAIVERDRGTVAVLCAHYVAVLLVGMSELDPDVVTLRRDVEDARVVVTRRAPSLRVGGKRAKRKARIGHKVLSDGTARRALDDLSKGFLCPNDLPKPLQEMTAMQERVGGRRISCEGRSTIVRGKGSGSVACLLLAVAALDPDPRKARHRAQRTRVMRRRLGPSPFVAETISNCDQLSGIGATVRARDGRAKAARRKARQRSEHPGHY
jgi:hypothetical protein